MFGSQLVNEQATWEDILAVLEVMEKVAGPASTPTITSFHHGTMTIASWTTSY